MPRRLQLCKKPLESCSDNRDQFNPGQGSAGYGIEKAIFPIAQ